MAAFAVVPHGSSAVASAADRRAMFDTISEMLPFRSVDAAVGLLLTGTPAVPLLGWLAWRERSPLLAMTDAAARPGVSQFATWHYAGQVVFADVNVTPEPRYRTKVLTVGSLWHRDMAAFLRLCGAWRSGPSGSEPPAVQATQASPILFGPSGARSLRPAQVRSCSAADRTTRCRTG